MASWKFDDVIQDGSESSLEHIEITITFSNGVKRWCSICTKAGLTDYVDRNMDGSVFLLENVIVVKNLTHEVVNEAIHELDQQDLLLNATRLLHEEDDLF